MSIYSTPIVSLSDHELSSEESLYFTPEVSFSCFTPCRRKNKAPVAANYYGELSPGTPVHSGSIQGSVLSIHQGSRFNDKENSPLLAYDSRYITPNKSSVCFTPKRTRSTPLKCISNIVTPVEVKRNIFKFDDRLAQLDKDTQSRAQSNSSFSINSISDPNTGSSLKPKHRSKCGSKSKSGVLQWLGVRHKSKTAFSIGNESKRKSVELNSSMIKEDESHLIFPVKNYGTIHERITEANSIDKGSRPLKSSMSDVISSNDSHLPLLPQKEMDYIKEKENTFWNYVKRYRPSISSRKIRLSPVKRLFLRCRQKLYFRPLTSLFNRKEEPICDKAKSFSPKPNACRCSVASSVDEEFMNKILSKLNSLENQIKEIKSLVHHKDGVAGPCNIPPPPPPPPPPPLPNVIPTASKRKINETTPESEQILKRSTRAAETRTQFSITVDDLRSVKLRKTPATSKRPVVNSTPGTIDGVLRSVKFKPSRRNAAHKKELSHIVADILSPSKKSSQHDYNLFPRQILDDNKENKNLDKYQTTPVKSIVNKEAKLRSIKSGNVLWQSPSRRRSSNNFKNRIYSDDAPRSTE